MKYISKKVLIWRTWILILIAISICYSLQAVQDVRPLLTKLPQGLLVCGIPYVYFTLFYVLALVMKQFIKIPFLFLTDLVCIVLVINNFGYFYEGPQVAFNSIVVAISIIVIRTIILLFNKKTISK